MKIKKFNNETIQKDLKALKKVINETNDKEKKEEALTCLTSLINLTEQDYSKINFNELNLDNNFLINYIIDDEKYIYENEINPYKNELFENTFFENYLDLYEELIKELTCEVPDIGKKQNSKQIINTFYRFENKYFKEDLPIINEIFNEGRIEIERLNNNNYIYQGLASNYPSIKKQYVKISYNSFLTSRVTETLAHEFGHVSQANIANINNISYTNTSLDEVPSTFHEQFFFDYYYKQEEENNLKKLVQYNNLGLNLNNNFEAIIYLYGMVIYDILNAKEDNKIKLKEKLNFIKENIGNLEDFELLDRLNISEKDLLEMNETKDKYHKLIKRYH